MLKFGNISEIDAAKGLARVEFDDDGIVSGWLSLLAKKSKDETEHYPLDVKEHVCCLMDERCENGVILGAIYSKDEKPGLTSKDKFGIKYKSGDEESYDRQDRKKLVKVGAAEHSLTQQGHTIKNGSETLKAILLDLLAQLEIETHPTPVGPTGPPTNAAAYAALVTRLNSLMES